MAAGCGLSSLPKLCDDANLEFRTTSREPKASLSETCYVFGVFSGSSALKSCFNQLTHRMSICGSSQSKGLSVVVVVVVFPAQKAAGFNNNVDVSTFTRAKLRSSY